MIAFNDGAAFLLANQFSNAGLVFLKISGVEKVMCIIKVVLRQKDWSKVECEAQAHVALAVFCL
jgi:hypothetical protein